MVYSNEANDAKRYSVKKYCLPKGIIKIHNVIINGKNFYDQPVDSDIKRYRIRQDNTTGSLLDYEYIKNH